MPQITDAYKLKNLPFKDELEIFQLLLQKRILLFDRL